jgi:hypothetical protein
MISLKTGGFYYFGVESSEGETVIHDGNRPEIQIATTP